MADRLLPLKIPKAHGGRQNPRCLGTRLRRGLNESGPPLACIPSPADVEAHDWG